MYRKHPDQTNRGRNPLMDKKKVKTTLIPTFGASLVTLTVKKLPPMQETWVQPLGREDPLEKKMATHPSVLAWRIRWTEEPGGLQFTGSQRVRHD